MSRSILASYELERARIEDEGSFLMNFIVIADPNALADKLNAVKKYISDITKVAEVSSLEDNGMRSSIVCVCFNNLIFLGARHQNIEPKTLFMPNCCPEVTFYRKPTVQFKSVTQLTGSTDCVNRLSRPKKKTVLIV